LHVAGQPGADCLAHAADYEVSRRIDGLVCRCPQHIDRMLSRKHREQSAGLGALAHDHGVGQLRAEQQPSDTGIIGDGPHDIGHPGAGLFVCRHRRYRGLGGGSQLGNHPIEDRGDEFLFVGEAFIEITGRQAGAAADRADGQRRDVLLLCPQQIQAGGQQPPAAFRESLGGLNPSIWPHARPPSQPG